MKKKQHIILWPAAASIAILLVALSACDPTSPQATGTVRIAAVLPLTGPLGFLGQNERLGMQLASEHQPMAKHKVEFVFEDSQGKPHVAVSAVSKLLNIDGIRIHVVSSTGPVLAALPAYKSSDDMLVIAQCMIPEVTKGYPFAYRLYPTSDEETDLLSQYATSQGYSDTGVLYVKGRSGEEAYDFFKKKFEAKGGRVPIAESYDLSEKDFRTLLQKFKQTKLDAIFVFGYSSSFPALYRQMQELGFDLPILSNIDMASGGVHEKVDQKFLERIVFPVPRYYFSPDDPKVQSFNAEVSRRGGDPNFDIAYFYDMTSILISAIQRTDKPTPDAVRNAILDLMPYDGVTGKVTLDENRDFRADLHLVRWKLGKVEMVSAQ